MQHIKLVSPKKKGAVWYYVCNGKKCPTCHRNRKNECKHTADIEYALYDDHPDDNFTLRWPKDQGPQMWEKIREKNRGSKKKTGGGIDGNKPTV